MPTDDRFAVCIANEGCDDLDLLKVYRVLPDERAAQDGLLRVIDESGEDYLYPADRFVPIEVQPTERQRLTRAVSR